MPRKAREKSNTGIYHVMFRGINRQTIFEDDGDHLKFIKTLQKFKENSELELYGYCLMGNHVHLLVREGIESLSLTMQRICSSYVYWYNWKYNRVGHLFQERYKSETIENQEHLLMVLRYIHQNPIKASMTNSLAGYKWSSYSEYIHEQSIIDRENILDLFADERHIAIKNFKEYMSEINGDIFLDYKEKHRVSDEELSKIIEQKYNVKKGLFHLLGKDDKNMMLKSLKDIRGVSIRQLVRVTGVSKFLVEKA